MKQYPANENLSNSIPPATLSSENDKRNSQQQVRYRCPLILLIELK